MESVSVAPEQTAVAPDDRAEQAQPVVHIPQKLITVAIVAGPAVALAILVPWLWGHAVNLSDLVIGVILYTVTGFGITIGYHRMFTHSGFTSRRPLRITLAVLGSMAVEGSVTSWVATHRRHHMFSDHSGDPHSPYRYGDHGAALLRGIAFAHLGWLFVSDASSAERYAPDMLRDRDVQRIDRLFPVLALASLAIPFGIGFAAVGDPCRRTHRSSLGRPGADGVPPPRHLVGQFVMPHVRTAIGWNRGPQHQSVAAGDRVAR